MADDWTALQIDAIVADHFAMLAQDIAGFGYNKAKHNRALQEITGRSRASIEFKHRNISAVLKLLGQPVVTGYLPAWNYQDALLHAVRQWIDAHPDWLPIPLWRVRHSVSEADNDRANLERFVEPPVLWFGPPPTQLNEPPPIDSAIIAALGQRFDVAERDARNRALGSAGEELVLHHERSALRSVGRVDLAERVRWTSKEDGEGFGYDITSYEPDGRPKLIEVKTTNGWERTPFHISRNECAVAEARREEWQLVRLYDFARKPRAFSLRPPLEAHISLAPTSFLAKLL